ncbi:efflux RND transporter periplasmic adaptor subunit [Solitalea koreensis]|uniref:Barrel-sandwich domain of CusB or HlyD membrane-fusion n=1 Tax=Solitalea koreensis TaxID=543615 RepID=A0A521BJR9_9SPHI|nr:HlyD family efflux transporter periplasmic adaptor subunit [Solitalea koreensis]SMO47333.1 Barrel-sandwich domain of CusB or HlyD membrane-fusion [Solitalea koreensis]
MKKKITILIFAFLSLILVYLIFFNKKKEQLPITAEAQKTDFKDQVLCSGELLAEFSEDINGPTSLARFNIYEVKLQDIIAEGTEVKKGDYICSLDKSAISPKINEANESLVKAKSELTKTSLDTALTLREARVEINNQFYEIEQKSLVLQQSKYEPPATIRQAELELEKTKRELKIKKEDYRLKQEKQIALMKAANSDVQVFQNRVNELMALQNSFVINAPKNGLVIYKTDWNGRKIKSGSTISPWNPVVASLPNLSSMLTKTFINEVDIRKIKKNQLVQVGFDAFPNIKLPGKVISVANMGEAQHGSDNKVFEVMIKLEKLNPAIKPGMSTSNAILISEIKNQLTIPLEAVYSDHNLSYAYVKNGSTIDKKEIKLGAVNENEAIILKGLNEKETVLLTEPESAKKLSIIRLTK